MLALAEELQLETFLEYNSGSNQAVFGSRSLAVPTATGLLSGLDKNAESQLADLQAMAASINVNAPWSSPNATLWDSMTFATWLDEAITNTTIRALLDTATGAVWSANPGEMSLLYVLSYIAAAGNETMTGTLTRLLSVKDGAQESRIVGGTGLLATGLAEKIGSEKISLNAPVHSITLQESSGHYLVTAKDVSVTATDVIVAMSPPLASRIHYAPPLPAHRDQLTQRMFMGALGKATAIYSHPFWRSAGLSGQVISVSGAVRTTFDVSPPASNGSIGAILGFVEADSMRELDVVPISEIQDRVTKDYVRYFGPQAANATQWVFKRWDDNVYSRGGPTALAGTGTLTAYGPALRNACGGIHWAGTEAAEYWTGYMDGAIRSGERAAGEVLLEK